MINGLEAQVLLEMGRPDAAAVLFDSLSRQHPATYAPTQKARWTVWMLAHEATAPSGA